MSDQPPVERRALHYLMRAKCDECGKTRQIRSPVVVVDNAYVGFGAAGLEDLFVEDEIGVLCYDCIGENEAEIYEPYTNV